MRPSTILPAALVAATTALAQSTVTFVSVMSTTSDGLPPHPPPSHAVKSETDAPDTQTEDLSTSTAFVEPTTTTSVGATGTDTTTAVVVTQTRSPGERAAAVEKGVLGVVVGVVGAMVM